MRIHPIAIPRHAGSEAVQTPLERAPSAVAQDRVEQFRIARATQLTSPVRLEPTSQRILETTADLVRIPSQGGIDDAQPICSALVAKLAEAGMSARVLMQGSRPVGVVAEIIGAHPGPTFALNAVVDTAPVGDSQRWSVKPFSAELRGNRLIGRGVGDSKVAASMFIEVGRELAQRTQEMHGRAVLFFDAAEHAGDFAGMLTFVEQYGRGADRVQGMIIGYPGNESLQVGSRGFHRSQWRTTLAPASGLEDVARAITAPQKAVIPEGRSIEFAMSSKATLTAVSGSAEGAPVGDGVVLEIAIRGQSAHSGASRALGVNALVKTATFLRALHKEMRGDDVVPQVVAIEGSKDFSVVPDLVRVKVFVPATLPAHEAQRRADEACIIADDSMPAPVASGVVTRVRAAGEAALSAVTVNFDVRTTLACDPDLVQTTIDKAAVDFGMAGIDCKVATVGSWPAFKLPDASALSQAMQKAINRYASKLVQPRISGPSNAGNVAAAFGIPATAGFGVVCKHAHASDESIDISTIPVAYKVHIEAVETLFKMAKREPANQPRALAYG